MLSSNSTILKNTIFLYIRMFVTMLVSLYTVRVVFRVLGVVDYGVYTAIGGVVSSLAFVSDVLANASQRFFSISIGEKNFQKLKRTFNLVLLIYFTASIVILLIAEVIGLWFLNSKMDIPLDRVAAANWVYQFAIFSFVVSLICSPFQSIIIAHEKMDIYAYMSILDVFLKLIIVLFLEICPLDKLEMYAVLIFVVTCINKLIYILICKSKYKETSFMFILDKQELKSIFSYSSWTLLGSFSYVANTQGINILFNLFFGPVANAAYGIANQVKTAVNSFAGNFFTATRPPIFKSYAQNDFVRTTQLFLLSSKIIFIFLFVIIVPIFIGIEGILKIWLGETPLYMPNFVRLMLIYALIVSLSEPITALVQAAGRVKKYHGIVDIFTLVSLPISYLIFKLNGSIYWGIGISIIVFFVAHFIRLFILKSFYEISIFQYIKKIFLPIMITIGIVIMAVFVGYQLVDNNILLIMFSVLISVLISWFVILSKEERFSLMNLIRIKI